MSDEPKQQAQRIENSQAVELENAQYGLEFGQIHERIESYITERLPQAEVRIEEPQDPNCKIAVVIPAYAEGSDILRPLGSLAEQEDIRPEEFEVLIVVNRGKELPRKTESESDNAYSRRVRLFDKSKTENAKSLQIIAALQRREVPADLSDEEVAVCQRIIEKGVKVYAVDKSTDGNALPTESANVGSARDRGVAEAVERFFARGKDGIIAQSDADTAFDRHYLSNLIRAFEQNPTIVGVASSLHFEKTSEVEAAIPSVIESLQQAYRGAWDRLLYARSSINPSETLQTLSQDVQFSGSGMASRAYVAALAGGVPHLAGGEDPAFSQALKPYGHVIKDNSAIAKPEARFSARVDVSAGHGQRLLTAADSMQAGGLKVPNPDAALVYVDIRHTLSLHLAEMASTLPAIEINGQTLLNEEQLARLQEAAKTASTVDDLLARSEIADIKDSIQGQIDNLYKPVPVVEATERLIALTISGNTQQLNDFEVEYSRLSSVERNFVAAREELISRFFTLTSQMQPHTIEPSEVMGILDGLQEPLGLNDEQLQQIHDDSRLLDNIARVATEKHAVSDAVIEMKKLYPYELTPLEENEMLRALLRLWALNKV